MKQGDMEEANQMCQYFDVRKTFFPSDHLSRAGFIIHSCLQGVPVAHWIDYNTHNHHMSPTPQHLHGYYCHKLVNLKSDTSF